MNLEDFVNVVTQELKDSNYTVFVPSEHPELASVKPHDPRGRVLVVNPNKTVDTFIINIEKA